MMADREMGIGTLLGLVVAHALGSSAAGAETALQSRYICSSQQALVVERDRATARVTYAGRSDVLKRKASGLGQKYLSSSAALIIDGPVAVFVASDGTDLGSCTKAVPVASTH